MIDVPVPAGSDLARMIEVLDGAGYAHVEETNTDRRALEYDVVPGGRSIEGGDLPDPLVTYHFSMTVAGGIGYVGFFCVFFYDAAGKLLTHGAWES